jgi:tetratricopeptide (TPR) repeat protein
VPGKAHYCSERSIMIRYRWAGAPPEGVQMWISVDGSQWLPWQWSGQPDEPFRFEPPRQGRMLIALAPAEKEIAALPESGYQALAIVFDWDEPLVRLIEAKRRVAAPASVQAADGAAAQAGVGSVARSADTAAAARSTAGGSARNGDARDVVRITWAAWDETFGDRPISLHWRSGPEQPWHLGVERLPNSGEFAWDVPASQHGLPLEVCLRATDRAGNVAEAVEQVEVPAPPEPKVVEAAPQTERTSVADAPARPATASGPTDAALEAERLAAIAEQHLARNEYDLAENMFRKALKADPTSHDVRLSLGVLLQRRGRHAEAVEAYQAVLAIKPQNATAWRNLALAYMTQRNYPRAQATLQKLLAVEPENPQTWIDLGDVEMLMGRSETARQHWQKARTLSEAGSETASRASKRLSVYTRKQ